MYIGNLEHMITSTEQEVYHDPKDYLDLHTDFDPSELYMSDDPEVEYEWEDLRTLAGVNVAEPELLELATVSSDDGGLMDICPDEDYDILSDDICIAKVALMYIRTASVLFIVR